MSRKVVLILCGVIAVGVGLAGYLARSRMMSMSQEANPEAYWRNEGQRVYARFDRVSSPEEIGRVLADAALEDPEGRLDGMPGQSERIRTLASEFLNTRLGAATASQYIDRMLSLGYRFKSVEEFETDYGPLSAVAAKAKLDNYTAPRHVFEALWDHPASRAARIEGICDGESAVLITMGHGRRVRWASRQPGGALGQDLWIGRSASNCRFWMRPPVTRESMHEEYETVTTAMVSVIGDVPGSGRRPLHIGMFYEPESDEWWIDSCAVANYVGTSEAWTCMEF